MRFLKNRKGQSGVTLMIGAAALVVTGVTATVILNSIKNQKEMISENMAIRAVNLFSTQLSMAASGGMITCSEQSQVCNWNEKYSKDQLNLRSVASQGDTLLLGAELCVPVDANDPNFCIKTDVNAEVKFADLQNLEQQQLIVGYRAAEDKDKHGLLLNVKAKYVTGSQNTVKEISKVSVARRPRAFLKVENDPGFCAIGCAAPEGNVPAPPCMSPPQLSGGPDQKGVVNVRVLNQGPGPVYKFKVERTFTPSQYFPDAQTETLIVYDSAQDSNFKPVEEGETIEFSDNQLPCLTGRVVNTVSIPNGQASYTNVSIGTAPYPTGSTEYRLLADTIEPQNVMVMSVGGTTIPAALQVTTNYVESPPPPPPPPDPPPDPPSPPPPGPPPPTPEPPPPPPPPAPPPPPPPRFNPPFQGDGDGGGN